MIKVVNADDKIMVDFKATNEELTVELLALFMAISDNGSINQLCDALQHFEKTLS